MEPASPSNAVTTPSKGKGKETAKSPKEKAIWDDNNTPVLIKLCVAQVQSGNKRNTYFNREGWATIRTQFFQQTGQSYDRVQLKNRLDQLRKEWTLWQSLKAETGIGWDEKRGTVDAPEEWWKLKIQREPKMKMFRNCGLKFEAELDILFSDCQATGENAWNGATGTMPFGQDRESRHGSYTPREENERLSAYSPPLTNPSPSEPASTQAGRGWKRAIEGSSFGRSSKMSGAAQLSRTLERIVSAVEVSTTVVSRRQSGPKISIEAAMDEVDNLPAVVEDDTLFLFVTTLFEDPVKREMFAALKKPEKKVMWLRHQHQMHLEEKN